jgi:hypothetical protein
MARDAAQRYTAGADFDKEQYYFWQPKSGATRDESESVTATITPSRESSAG